VAGGEHHIPDWAACIAVYCLAAETWDHGAEFEAAYFAACPSKTDRHILRGLSCESLFFLVPEVRLVKWWVHRPRSEHFCVPGIVVDVDPEADVLQCVESRWGPIIWSQSQENNGRWSGIGQKLQWDHL